MVDNSSYIFFYGHSDKSGLNKCFSNWYPSNFTDKNGYHFGNSEQYIMYQKAKLFNDNNVAEKILLNSDPKFV